MTHAPSLQKASEAVVELYFDDLFIAQEIATFGATVTEDAIVRFGMEWDFQPFHVDRIAAEASLYGGLIASGLHTMAVTLRLCMHRGLFTGTAVAGLEWGRIRFIRPVRPGDTLRALVKVLSKRASQSRPGHGIVKWGVTTFNQSEERVLESSLTNLVLMRSAQLTNVPVEN